MQQYLEKGKEVLKILLNNGCEAYLIGSCVCNTILDIPFNIMEITTNATPEMVKGIFQLAKVEDEKEGVVRLTYLGYVFLIETFRLESSYKDDRTPIRSHYSKNLHDDLACRDFTINAIAMSHGGKLTDAYGGFEDIQKKRIKTIGNARVRFFEDPLRMLIAIRFVSELRFRIEHKTLKAMIKKRKLLKKIPINIMLNEIKRIIVGKYFKKAISYLFETKLYKYIPILSKEFKRLANDYRAESIDTFVACAFIQNGAYAPEWEELVENKERIKKVVELALANPKSNYDNKILFLNGLEVCLDANYINVLTNKSRKKARKIKKVFKALPIHDYSELKLTEKDVFDLLSYNTLQNEDLAHTVIENIALKVINHELINEYETLKAYAIDYLRNYTLDTDKGNVNQDDSYSETYQTPKEVRNETVNYQMPLQVQRTNANINSYNSNNENNLPTSKIDEIERRVSEYERSLREKDQRIKELEKMALRNKLDNDLNNLVGQNLEILKDMNYIDKGTEKIYLSRELKEMYEQVLTNVDPKYRLLKEEENNKEGNENNEKQN